MKQFYRTFQAPGFAKILVLSVLFLCAYFTSGAQVYYASLSGANEFPPNNSPGTGKSVVTINGNFMRVQASFSGLVGTTTASHIHAPTAVPLTGAAGVATQVPRFIDFPVGVQAGTYDHTFDMTQASSYNPAFLTANAGSTEMAFASLKAAIAAGKSYLNVHSTVFPGGEIRGFLLPCPTLMVSIPDAFALAQGVLPNTVYPAYAPAASLALRANVSGGTGPYTYDWSNGAETASVTVRPTVTTPYSVTVTDQNGCSGSASRTVNVVNVAGGNKGDKIVVCHKGNNALTIAAPAVAAHLAHGDMLGSCSVAAQVVKGREPLTERTTGALLVNVLSNPSPNDFELQISGKADNGVQLRVYDLLGRVVEARSSLQSNRTLRLGAFYKPGTYVVQIVQGTQVKTLRLVKTK